MRAYRYFIVTISLVLLLVLGYGVYWSYIQRNANSLESIRLPDVTLTTTGLTKPEKLSLCDKSTWFNPYSLLIPTGSFIQVDATYRYEVALRNTWCMVFDAKRKVAFVIIPIIKPRLPVEFKISRDEIVIAGVHMDSKWFWKFEDKDQFEKKTALLKVLNTLLAEKAISADYIDLRKGEARQMAESYIAEWLIRQGICTTKDQTIVKAYFEDERDLRIPLPPRKLPADFKP